MEIESRKATCKIEAMHCCRSWVYFGVGFLRNTQSKKEEETKEEEGKREREPRERERQQRENNTNI